MKMKIGLIDVDNYTKLNDCFPNLVLMKLSAYHKSQGDTVEWYQPMFSGHCDKVYMSKVFSFTEDYPYPIDSDVVEKGGSGYCISLVDGKEVFDKSKHKDLPYEIEHIMPDYSLYGITDTAYGFMSRGCPRGCDFVMLKTKRENVRTRWQILVNFGMGRRILNCLILTHLPVRNGKTFYNSCQTAKLMWILTKALISG